MLLLVFASCVRLQNEEEGYIQKFMERHLSARNQMRMPHHWYETSGTQIDNVSTAYAADHTKFGT